MPNNPTEFDRLVDDYFDAYFQFHPKDATAAGFHQYDSKLEDFSRAAREADLAWVPLPPSLITAYLAAAAALFVPLTRLALAPLALAWNRHR